MAGGGCQAAAGGGDCGWAATSGGGCQAAADGGPAAAADGSVEAVPGGCQAPNDGTCSVGCAGPGEGQEVDAGGDWSSAGVAAEAGGGCQPPEGGWPTRADGCHPPADGPASFTGSGMAGGGGAIGGGGGTPRVAIGCQALPSHHQSPSGERSGPGGAFMSAAIFA
jgi:hypothetical protein